jgi:hypothetical protein
MPTAFCVELKGNINVKQTSDTAMMAKNKAMNHARRQILLDVLSQYATKEYLNDVLQKASDEELMDLIVSTSVSNEQISSDTYSANVMMILDNEAVKRWLNDKDIQNWIPSVNSGERFTAFIVVQNGMTDWAELKRIARDDKVAIETQSITGNQILVKIPLNYRSKFTASIRSAGWKYTDNGGVLQVWK